MDSNALGTYLGCMFGMFILGGMVAGGVIVWLALLFFGVLG